jgi:hypothetical protein
MAFNPIDPASRPFRITFDSNAWEQVFADDPGYYSEIIDALNNGQVEGFICVAGFQIEAIRKRDRPAYFSSPKMDVRAAIEHRPGGGFALRCSMGPDDVKHPGLPAIQAAKLQRALRAGIKLMRAQPWMGLPTPEQVGVTGLYAVDQADRAARQLMVSDQIEARGLGYSAFQTAGGWDARDRTPTEERALTKACAEWADGEIVAAHFAYANDILCTNDRAASGRRSILDAKHRAWLAADFGTRFATLEELIALLR